MYKNVFKHFVNCIVLHFHVVNYAMSVRSWQIRVLVKISPYKTVCIIIKTYGAESAY